MKETVRIDLFLPKSLKADTVKCSHIATYGNLSEYIRQALELYNQVTKGEKTVCQKQAEQSSESSGS